MLSSILSITGAYLLIGVIICLVIRSREVRFSANDAGMAIIGWLPFLFLYGLICFFQLFEKR